MCLSVFVCVLARARERVCVCVRVRVCVQRYWGIDTLLTEGKDVVARIGEDASLGFGLARCLHAVCIQWA